MSTRPLRALVVDDSPVDAELVVHELRRQGFAPDWRRVATADALRTALAGESWDVVLCDYAMPGFGGLEALAILRDTGLDLPFLLISGTVGEDVAVEAMRAGAHDYLLKDRLTRLGAAVERELHEAEERRERRRAQEAERAAQVETRRLLAEAEASRRALLSAAEDLQAAAADRRLQASALEAAANAILITDRDGDIVWVNAAFTALTGYALEEARGRNPRVLVRSGVHRPEEYAVLWRTILAGDVWRGELVNRRKDGSLYPEEQTITPVRDGSGAITHFIAVKQDVSERREAEAKRLALETQLRQAQKMESVGRLAGGVAHDFNNALGVVLGHADLALKEVPPGSALARHLEAIREAGRRSANLTRQLLGFARQQPAELQLLDVNDRIEGMLRLLRQLIGEDVRLGWRPGAGLWPVRADPGQIDQLVSNLVVNARDAITGVGAIDVATRNLEADEAFVGARPGLVPGQYVCLDVKDDGSGIAPDLLERIFEPFFTTKATGRGTGLGLATVYGIARQNGGYVGVESEPGRGSTFTVLLPALAGQREAEAPATATEELRGGSETVLVVEDEPAMLEVTRDVLVDLGYRVLATSSPGEALSIAAAEGDRLDLLVTDLVMPLMNGRELAALLQARHPRLRCVFVSGYTADIVTQRGIVEPGVQLLSKPFTASELAARVRKVMDA
ncbi:MAG: response regulator [Vicinamibacteria bacterium]|nr:response regulator [Vicinamibacteria bacterium]